MPAPRALAPGTAIGPYKLGKELGRGGFAMVYIAMDTRTGGSLAVKHMEVTNMEEEERESMQVGPFARRFVACARHARGAPPTATQAEIALMKRLDHDNIVQYLGSHVDGSSFFIMMECVGCCRRRVSQRACSTLRAPSPGTLSGAASSVP